MFIASYTGARPLGRPLPALAEAPQGCEALPLHLIYSFARDPAHDGRFEFYDPWQLEQASRQQCGCQRGMLSLAGAGFAWGPAVPLDTWVANAAQSLQALLDRYRLVGLDINYEEGLDAPGAADSFAEAMAALIGCLKSWRPGLLVTVAPYAEVWGPYRQLLQLAGGAIDYINWQAYAELESPDSTAEQLVAVYERLARELGGYGRLTLGVNTEPEQRRGPQLAACLAAFQQLRPRGLGGAFVWALENSCCAAYAAETALLRLAAEPLLPAAAGGAAAAAGPAGEELAGGGSGGCLAAAGGAAGAPAAAAAAQAAPSMPSMSFAGATSAASVMGTSLSNPTDWQSVHSAHSGGQAAAEPEMVAVHAAAGHDVNGGGGGGGQGGKQQPRCCSLM